jgi:hypothetical protein
MDGAAAGAPKFPDPNKQSETMQGSTDRTRTRPIRPISRRSFDARGPM